MNLYIIPEIPNMEPENKQMETKKSPSFKLPFCMVPLFSSCWGMKCLYYFPPNPRMATSKAKTNQGTWRMHSRWNWKSSVFQFFRAKIMFMLIFIEPYHVFPHRKLFLKKNPLGSDRSPQITRKPPRVEGWPWKKKSTLLTDPFEMEEWTDPWMALHLW